MAIKSNIPGYDRYINEKGEVHSTFSGKKLKLLLRKDGYLSFHLDNKGKKGLVHRYVAITFLPIKDGKNEVCHKNNIKTDNRVENLYWGTHLENMQQARRDGLIPPLSGEDAPMYGTIGELAPRSTIPNLTRVEMVKYYDKVGVYKRVAERFGMSLSRVRRIIKNRNKWQ